MCRSMSSSLHEMHTDLHTYVSQMKYYERMQKVKERQQHVQEASSGCYCVLKSHQNKAAIAVNLPCAYNSLQYCC